MIQLISETDDRDGITFHIEGMIDDLRGGGEAGQRKFHGITILSAEEPEWDVDARRLFLPGNMLGRDVVRLRCTQKDWVALLKAVNHYNVCLGLEPGLTHGPHVICESSSRFTCCARCPHALLHDADGCTEEGFCEPPRRIPVRCLEPESDLVRIKRSLTSQRLHYTGVREMPHAGMAGLLPHNARCFLSLGSQDWMIFDAQEKLLGQMYLREGGTWNFVGVDT
jgi:hypothetical protein